MSLFQLLESLLRRLMHPTHGPPRKHFSVGDVPFSSARNHDVILAIEHSICTAMIKFCDTAIGQSLGTSGRNAMVTVLEHLLGTE